MKKILLITAFLLSIFNQNLSAQSADTLSVFQFSTWTHDTVFMNDNVNVTVILQNDGSSFVGDSIILYATVNTTGDTALIEQLGALTMLANDTLTFPLTWQIDPTKYIPDNNITVIWPANESGTTHAKDSLFLSSYVIDTTVGIKIIAPVRLKVFPNPTSDELFIDVDRPEDYAHVKIIDAQGRVVMFVEEVPKVIYVNHLVTGLYHIHLQKRNGEVAIGQMMVTR